MRTKKWVADKLIKLAYRIDPNRPSVLRDGNNYVIYLGGIGLAEIGPGMVNDMRGTWD